MPNRVFILKEIAVHCDILIFIFFEACCTFVSMGIICFTWLPSLQIFRILCSRLLDTICGDYNMMISNCPSGHFPALKLSLLWCEIFCTIVKSFFFWLRFGNMQYFQEDKMKDSLIRLPSNMKLDEGKSWNLLVLLLSLLIMGLVLIQLLGRY